MIDSVNPWAFCLTPSSAMPGVSGSPSATASAAFFTCSTMRCGGTGGVSGSTTISGTQGVFDDSASSQALPMSYGLSHRMPRSPSSSATNAAISSCRAWMNSGSPSARSSAPSSASIPSPA